MIITTWDFYQNEYYGDVITESLFDKYQAKAIDKLQMICFNRINEETINQYETAISKAICAIMDVLFQIDEAAKNVNDPKAGNVKSMSSGSESISFGNNETIYMKVMSDMVAQRKLLRDTACEYLADTGLMYAGD